MRRNAEIRQPLAISRTSIEDILARSISVFALVLYGVSLPDVFAQLLFNAMDWGLVLLLAIPAAMVCTALARPGRWRHRAAGTAAALLLLSFVLWHLGVIGGGDRVASRPWSWGFAGIGIALACIATDARISAVYGAIFSSFIFLVPLTVAGNARAWYESGQDALLTAAMTVVIISPITALRKAARASDDAADRAVLEAGAAARAEALRAERTRLDGLTHDAIMATLTAASKAESADMMAAAAAAAQSSLLQLESLHSRDEVSSISPDELVNRIVAATAGYPTRITRKPPSEGAPASLPLAPSRALIQATAEAVRNSSLHSRNGQSEVTISLSRDSGTGMCQALIEIRDDGPGFDISSIPEQRLGIRVSIMKRMRDVAGQATITSKPGAETRVQLIWKGPEAA
ncbi:ATP-binding protein [Arthrobacter sp. KNU40]|uniref:ATP-binding protein n=1 Tax=Arthrobacter sp. KNU40 TaxID=3447965 RepID=UPI003F5E34E3